MRKLGILALSLAMPMMLSARGPLPAPQRIVSLNPCVDAVLYRIAEPQRIAAISNYSQDPAATSVPLNWARRFRGIYGTAEEVIALKPDLVIASVHTDLATRTALTKAGIRLVLAGVPASIAESRAGISDIATAIGRPAAGAALNATIDRALAEARPAPGARPIPALIYEVGGLVPGSGTLADELLTRAGFRNASRDYGLKMWDVLPIEPLVAHPPRVILTNIERRRPDGSFTDATRSMRGRALAMLGKRVTVADFAPSLLYCAGPNLIAASKQLAAVRARVTQ